MAIKVCELDQFKSFIDAVKTLSSAVVHFNDTNNTIDIHTVDSAGTILIWARYNTPIHHAFDISLDLQPLQQIKANEVKILFDEPLLHVKVDKVTHKVPSLSDPSVTRREKEMIDTVWPHHTMILMPDDMKALIDIINSKMKYDWTVTNNILRIQDTDNTVEMEIEVDACDGDVTYASRYGGALLEDVLMAPKHFDKCIIKLGKDTPLHLEYNCEWLNLQYVVAPMIEEG